MRKPACLISKFGVLFARYRINDYSLMMVTKRKIQILNLYQLEDDFLDAKKS